MDIYRDASAAQRDVSNMLHTQFSLGIGGSIDLQVLVSDESWEADSKLRYMVLQKMSDFYNTLSRTLIINCKKYS